MSRFFIGLLFCLGVMAIAAADNTTNTPLYQKNSCPQFFPKNAICGTLTVIEDRQNNRGQILLPVIRLQPQKISASPAVILGGGGPGGYLQLDSATAMDSLETWRDKIIPNGELILIDQRGSGLAKPHLSCAPDMADSISDMLRRRLSLKSETEIILPLLQQCLKRWQKQGVIVSAYTTQNSADDIEDLRLALALPPWNIIGFSYGTRLALEVMRRYPTSVRAALLDSLFPFDAHLLSPSYPFASVVEKINNDCQQSGRCAEHGDVLNNLQRAIEQLQTTSITLTARRPSLSKQEVALTPQRLLDIIFLGLYNETGVYSLPLLSRHLANGDYNNPYMEFFLDVYLSFVLDKEFADMLNWHINCNELSPFTQTPSTPPADWLRQHTAIQYQFYSNVCRAIWPNSTITKTDTVQTDSPLLIISGDYDPITPSGWASAVAARLPNAQLLSVKSSHTSSSSLTCLWKDINNFLAHPTATVTNSCAKEETLNFY